MNNTLNSPTIFRAYNFKDLAGQKFSRLTVLRFLGRFKPIHAKKPYTSWVCRCDCGNILQVRTSHLPNGHTKSCGCFNKEALQARRTHGMSEKRVYKIWAGIKKRCNNPNSFRYNYYGGRGIKMCDRWQTFENFYFDMGDCPANYEIDRINNNRDYSPENCRWTTKMVQGNNKRNNHLMTFKGRTLTLSEWGRLLGIKASVLSARIARYHWPIEKTLSEPVRIQARRRYR